jgi:hypothetical protein
VTRYPVRYRPPSRYLRYGRYRRRASNSDMIVGLALGAVLLASGATAGAARAVHHPARHTAAPPQPAPQSLPPGNVVLGQVLAAAWGWSGGSQWACLYALWERESGWQNLIMNRSSGAWGIAQALGHGGSAAIPALIRFPDGATESGVAVNQYPSAAANRGDARAQIEWGLAYIAGRYGTPCGAWSHEQTDSWY